MRSESRQLGFTDREKLRGGGRVRDKQRNSTESPNKIDVVANPILSSLIRD